jgi:hypothetical protein
MLAKAGKDLLGVSAKILGTVPVSENLLVHGITPFVCVGGTLGICVKSSS